MTIFSAEQNDQQRLEEIRGAIRRGQAQVEELEQHLSSLRSERDRLLGRLAARGAEQMESA